MQCLFYSFSNEVIAFVFKVKDKEECLGFGKFVALGDPYGGLKNLLLMRYQIRVDVVLHCVGSTDFNSPKSFENGEKYCCWHFLSKYSQFEHFQVVMQLYRTIYGLVTRLQR